MIFFSLLVIIILEAYHDPFLIRYRGPLVIGEPQFEEYCFTQKSFY